MKKQRCRSKAFCKNCKLNNNKVYNIILRKEKKTNYPIIFYRYFEYHPTLLKALTYFADNVWGYGTGGHGHCRLDYYLDDTKPATFKECKNLLKRLFSDEEKYKIYKKLNYDLC